ncbi:hypothetical protein M422DRAFT_779666 [Sphaerobolus stellatus SS14]|uniref:Uncharacterized protein n=1 Tax=Sphaerobolus stellatus (strain SS14) TaxID=990650 RepID=A0A0C9VZ45_SPHS4|nr:hypothetical protein M422DRAFT_779666 [Sphaerobolus stellatus SS14]
MAYAYPGLFNSSYTPGPYELLYLETYPNQPGGQFLGPLFTTLLQGISFIQYGDCFVQYHKEKRWTKWIVHSAFTLSVLKNIYLVWYMYFVTRFGDWGDIQSVANSSGIALSTGIMVATLDMALGFQDPLNNRTLVERGFAIVGPAANIHYAYGLSCDIIITSFSAQKSGFGQTDTLVYRLVRISVESAMTSTLVTLVTLSLSNKISDNQWFLLANIPFSHVYLVSLLYTVDARCGLSDGLSGVMSDSNYAKQTKNGKDPNWMKLVMMGKSQTTQDHRITPAVRVDVQTMQYDENSNMAESKDGGDDITEYIHQDSRKPGNL